MRLPIGLLCVCALGIVTAPTPATAQNVVSQVFDGDLGFTQLVTGYCLTSDDEGDVYASYAYDSWILELTNTGGAVETAPFWPASIPFGMDTDAAGNLYASLVFGVYRFPDASPPTSTAILQDGWALPGGGTVQYVDGRGLRVDAAGAVYTTSFGSNTAYKIETDGTITELLSSGDGFGDPTDVAVGPNGNVFIGSDYGGGVLVVRPDGTQVPVTGTIGGTSISGAAGLEVDAQGALYVSDSGNDRVLRIVPAAPDWIGSPSVEILLDSSQLDSSGNPFTRPGNTAMDAQGDLYVVALGPGALSSAWRIPADPGEPPEELIGPSGDGTHNFHYGMGITVTPQGYVFVVTEETLPNGTPADIFRICADADQDGVCDRDDNCLDVANPSQLNADGDCFGNACDPDFNDDLIVGVPDFAPIRVCDGQSVPGSGGPEDPTCEESDLDGSGVVDDDDFAIFQSFFGGPPGPSGICE